MPSDEIRYQLLKAIDENSSVSQRELAAKLEVSLGKTNYCIKELIKLGLIKIGNSNANQKKTMYTYLLTPSGVREKSKVTTRFLRKKMNEYEQIKQQIAQLKEEVRQAGILEKK